MSAGELLRQVILRERHGKPVDTLQLWRQGESVRVERSYEISMPGGGRRPVTASCTAKTLAEAVAGALGSEYPTSRSLEIVAYIRATSWGVTLP